MTQQWTWREVELSRFSLEVGRTTRLANRWPWGEAGSEKAHHRLGLNVDVLFLLGKAYNFKKKHKETTVMGF